MNNKSQKKQDQTTRQTAFSDVCGTLDEMKRRLNEEYDTVAKDPKASFESLLLDIRYMLDRMHIRIEEYRGYRQKLNMIQDAYQKIENVDHAPAHKAADAIGKAIDDQQQFETIEKTTLEEWAEQIRDVANAQENRLRACKDLALELYDLFTQMKGSRNWIETDESMVDDVKKTLERKYQAWMPPKPHKEALLEFLVKARASVADAKKPGEEPMVYFEDGGSIAMSKVRYDPDLRNFHPASFQPGKSGLNYRG